MGDLIQTAGGLRKSVGLVGLGAVGKVIADAVGARSDTYELTAVSARDKARAQAYLDSRGMRAKVVDAPEVAEHADVVVECAPSSIFRSIAEPAIRSGKELIVLSVGALLEAWDLVAEAERTGAIIHVPTGALAGLDGIQGARQGIINSVKMVTRKPIAGLQGAPFLVERNIDISNLTERHLLFSGTAREAIAGFPANLNVAVAVSLAGIGPDRTELEIWADPDVERNTHHIHVDSDSVTLDLHIANIPTENPKTGRLTALSVVAMLDKMNSSLRVGT